MTAENTGEITRIKLSEHGINDGQARGLVCRKCGCTHFFVVYTRPIAGGIRRSRECRNCSSRVITTERFRG